MSYLVLARKYRPQAFEEVVGQDHVTQTLKNAIRANRVPHALLFAGPRGVGKTSVARIMAKAMNCDQGPSPSPCNACQRCKEITEGSALDVLEIDGASNRGINEIRELRENVKYMPGSCRFKIYIIDEVHMLTTEAFNALLKTLEEPPSHVLFFFATTEPHKIPITILSRCQRHNFKRIRLEDIEARLQHVCKDQSFKMPEEGLHLLAREATGSMRDALSLLDQVIAYSEGEPGQEQILDSLGAIDRKTIFGLASALLSGRLLDAFTLLEGLYNYGHDMKRLYMQILEHFRHLLVVKMGAEKPPLLDIPPNEMTVLKEQVKDLSLDSINQIFSILFHGEADVRLSPQPRLALEALFVRLVQLKQLVSLDQIIDKLNAVAKQFGNPHDHTEQEECVERPRQEPLELSKTTEVPHEKPKSSEDLTQIWEQLLAASRERYPSLAPSLEKAALTKIGEDALEVTVGGNSFYAARLHDQKSIASLEKMCKEFFRRKMRINILEAQGAPGLSSRAKESDRARRLKKEALNHPIVADVIELFKGKVIEVKIL